MLQMDAISCIELEEEQRNVASNYTITAAILSTDGTKSQKYYKSVVDLELF